MAADDVRVVHDGMKVISESLKGTAILPVWIGWGTGATATANTDSALVTEVTITAEGGRVQGTAASTTVTSSGDTYKVTGTITATTAHTLREVGLFCTSSAGSTMFLRGMHDAISVAEGDSVAYTIKTVFASTMA